MAEELASDRRRLSLTVQRTLKRMGRWEYPAWRVGAIADLDAGAAPAEAGPGEQVLAPLTIQLHRDACEGYWYNLSGDTPAVFLVRSADEDDELFRPLLVSVNHDDAAAHLETDDTVISIAMPDSLRDWLQAYVDRNYRPQVRRKRQRKQWDEETDEPQGPRARRPVRDR